MYTVFTIVTMSTLIKNDQSVNNGLYPPGAVSSLFGVVSGQRIALCVRCVGARFKAKKLTKDKISAVCAAHNGAFVQSAPTHRPTSVVFFVRLDARGVGSGPSAP